MSYLYTDIHDISWTSAGHQLDIWLDILLDTLAERELRFGKPELYFGVGVLTTL